MDNVERTRGVAGLCDVCGTNFNTRKILYRHMRVKHRKNIYVQPRKEICNICDKLVIDVNKHMKRHNFASGKVGGKLVTSLSPYQCCVNLNVTQLQADGWFIVKRAILAKMLRRYHQCDIGDMTCTECNTFRCSWRQDLIQHLKCVHQQKMKCKEMTFSSLEGEETKKEQMEVEEKVSFIRPRGKQKCDYFVCHRSGYADKTASGRRLREPSIKIGGTCPACSVVRNVSSNMVNVKFYRTHTGHSLSKVRESIQVGLFRRVHLLSKQDIRNIRKEYKLDDSSAHQDDATSVDLWVRQQERLGKDSLVIYYKAQGTEDNGNKLLESDFMIVLMTEYKFYLTTLLTVDEFGAGCPVSYCFRTHTDTRSMQVFFEQIKKCIGNFKTKVFISDDCDSHCSAWSVVMGHSEHRLLCTWHVDRTWRWNICVKVNGNAMLKSTVYKALKTLYLQTEREKFSELLDGFLTWCVEEEGIEEFGKYFKDKYSWRAHMWAYSYRIGLGLNTNMFLEANHKTLKYSYLLKKINNRVDKCIHALLHRMRDSLFQRLIRLCKGTERTGRSAEISKSHRRGCGINKELIHCVEDGTWHL
ncbi:uncharacterized protein LOC126298004 [Schistocerca gregaria]|uniref:uncharacterized protein LOC126298004 n=1 Tax=Schistocerca gregaria TaxID=7010 RepID=UPI00211EC67E|nr:uncharacterized protein LOC126298004 [Schistocerca gregaria]